MIYLIFSTKLIGQFNELSEYFIVSRSGSTIKIWNLIEGQVTKTLDGNRSLITSLAVSPNGLKIVLGSFDHSVQIWSMVTGKLLDTFNDHANGVISLAISHDNLKTVSCDIGRNILIWNLETGQLLNKLTDPTDIVSKVMF
jgi:WD40 repeat protein